MVKGRQSSDDYTDGTKGVMPQIRVWSRGMVIVLRRTKRPELEETGYWEKQKS